MAGNYLEQLISEWYEYKGYFIRRNVLVGKRLRGGYECELDIVALHPPTNKVIHIEPSMDADSWSKREQRYKKKFDAGRKHIPSLFKGIELRKEIEQIAVFVFGSKKQHPTLAGGKVVLVSELLTDIFSEIKSQSISSNAISEKFPILRSFQLVAEYRKTIFKVLDKKAKSTTH